MALKVYENGDQNQSCFYLNPQPKSLYCLNYEIKNIKELFNFKKWSKKVRSEDFNIKSSLI